MASPTKDYHSVTPATVLIGAQCRSTELIPVDTVVGRHLTRWRLTSQVLKASTFCSIKLDKF